MLVLGGQHTRLECSKRSPGYQWQQPQTKPTDSTQVLSAYSISCLCLLYAAQLWFGNELFFDLGDGDSNDRALFSIQRVPVLLEVLQSEGILNQSSIYRDRALYCFVHSCLWCGAK